MTERNLEIECMTDFYKLQTDEESPLLCDVVVYFGKLLKHPVPEDVQEYRVFEAEYMKTAKAQEVT